jgi:organic radical activating enzyme
MNIYETEDFSRKINYPGRILFIDGLTGTGKTIFIKLINSTHGSFPVSFNYALEQLCISNYFGKTSIDTAESLIKLNLDQARFDFNISREVNFRVKDLSSVWHSREKLKFFLRLFNDGNDDSDLYKSPKFLTFVVHQLLQTTEIMRDKFKDDFYKILCTRHPAYLYYHWKSYIGNHGSNPRDITLHRLINNHDIPWFIEKNKNNFQNMTLEDKTAVTIAELTNSSLKHINDNKGNKNLVVIDFENFVLNPDGYLEKLNNWFNLDSKVFSRVLTKENIPRKHINQSIKKSIYLRYESGKLSTSESHQLNYENLLKSIRGEVSSDSWERFVQSIEEYEDRFPKWY